MIFVTAFLAVVLVALMAGGFIEVCFRNPDKYR